jgi:hypothetical protein
VEGKSTSGAASLEAQAGLLVLVACYGLLEPPVSYLESTIPTAAYEMAIILLAVPYLFLRHFLHRTTVMIRKVITADECGGR